MDKNKIKTYIQSLPKRYFITAFSGMAQGLFVTLIAGTILAQVAGWIGDNAVGNTLLYIAAIAKSLMGAGIGVGIAHALNKNKLLVFSSAVAGMVGAFADKLLFGTPFAGMFPSVTSPFTTLSWGAPGNPIGAYVVTMLAVELVECFAGKTKLDILLVPLGTLLLSFVGIFLAAPFIWFVDQIGKWIALATQAKPLIMGIIIAVTMGILLTLPTSSAAIWVTMASPVLATGSGAQYEAMLLAGGAATVGCACHMVGFAVASYKENGIAGLISQGLGTSMLQIPNVMKKPVIMLPMVASSAILGPLSTCVFRLKCGASGGGMGTSGLVGVFGLLDATSGALGYVGIVLLMLVLPVLLNAVIAAFMRKKGIIKDGDMKIPD